VVDSNGEAISNRCNIMVYAVIWGVEKTTFAATTAFHHMN
jgi:hypothetical protein